MKKDPIPAYDQAIEALENENSEVLADVLMAFESDDRYYIEQVIHAIRALLKRTDLAPDQIVGIGHALHGLGRLPLRTPGLDVYISLSIKNESGAEEYELYFTEDELVTTSGGYVDSGCGSDSFSGPSFRVETGFREYQLSSENWPDIFREMTGAKLEVENCSNDSILDWHHPDGTKFWQWIANHD